MIIRLAERRDAEAIAAIWNAMIRDTLFTFTTDTKTVTEIDGLISDRAGAFWVAQAQKEAEDLLGFVTYGPFRAGPGYAATVEHSIVVRNDVVGQGTGRALMARACTGAAAQGHHVMVAAISGQNTKGVAFHRALGFVPVGHLPQVGRKRGHWIDLILMQKMLGGH